MLYYHWFLVIVGVLLFVTNVEGSRSIRAIDIDDRIGKLLDLSEFALNWNELVDIHIGNDKNISKYNPIIKSFLNKFIPFEEIRPFYIQAYRQSFTANEINKMTKYYSSRVAHKFNTYQKRIGDHVNNLMDEFLESKNDELQQWLIDNLMNDESGLFAKLVRAFNILFN